MPLRTVIRVITRLAYFHVRHNVMHYVLHGCRAAVHKVALLTITDCQDLSPGGPDPDLARRVGESPGDRRPTDRRRPGNNRYGWRQL
jgi:hypothetical protein